jgi:hypothetical protein
VELAVYGSEPYCPDCDAYEPADPTLRVLIADFSGHDETAEAALRDLLAVFDETEGGESPVACRMASIARAALDRIAENGGAK